MFYSRVFRGFFALTAFFLLADCAPFQNISRTAREKGCYYLSNHYENGERIDTNEPCLNCTCLNSMLMCYLRICPFVKPMGEECIIEKEEGDCCPKIWCPEVIKDKESEDSKHEGHPSQPGCYLDGVHYSDGAQLPRDPRKPCEVCYCIRNSTACVVQECELKVVGCSPIYKDGQCCPCRYNCTYEESTTAPPGVTIAELSDGCTLEDGTFIEDGEAVNSSNPCDHCYCMRNELVCAIQECQAPGPHCTPLPSTSNQCCPDRYECNEAVHSQSPDNFDELTTPTLKFSSIFDSSEETLTSDYNTKEQIYDVESPKDSSHPITSHDNSGIKGLPKKDILSESSDFMNEQVHVLTIEKIVPSGVHEDRKDVSTPGLNIHDDKPETSTEPSELTIKEKTKTHHIETSNAYLPIRNFGIKGATRVQKPVLQTTTPLPDSESPSSIQKFEVPHATEEKVAIQSDNLITHGHSTVSKDDKTKEKLDHSISKIHGVKGRKPITDVHKLGISPAQLDLTDKKDAEEPNVEISSSRPDNGNVDFETALDEVKLSIRPTEISSFEAFDNSPEKPDPFETSLEILFAEETSKSDIDYKPKINKTESKQEGPWKELLTQPQNVNEISTNPTTEFEPNLSTELEKIVDDYEKQGTSESDMVTSLQTSEITDLLQNEEGLKVTVSVKNTPTNMPEFDQTSKLEEYEISTPGKDADRNIDEVTVKSIVATEEEDTADLLIKELQKTGGISSNNLEGDETPILKPVGGIPQKGSWSHIKGKRPSTQGSHFIGKPNFQVGGIPGERISPAPEILEKFSTPQPGIKRRPVVMPIPGEGICRVENRVYQNGEAIESTDVCKKNCQCINSRIFCDSITCEDLPEKLEPGCIIAKNSNECCAYLKCEFRTTMAISDSTPASQQSLDISSSTLGVEFPTESGITLASEILIDTTTAEEDYKSSITSLKITTESPTSIDDLGQISTSTHSVSTEEEIFIKTGSPVVEEIVSFSTEDTSTHFEEATKSSISTYSPVDEKIQSSSIAITETDFVEVYSTISSVEDKEEHIATTKFSSIKSEPTSLSSEDEYSTSPSEENTSTGYVKLASTDEPIGEKIPASTTIKNPTDIDESISTGYSVEEESYSVFTTSSSIEDAQTTFKPLHDEDKVRTFTTTSDTVDLAPITVTSSSVDQDSLSSSTTSTLAETIQHSTSTISSTYEKTSLSTTISTADDSSKTTTVTPAELDVHSSSIVFSPMKSAQTTDSVSPDGEFDHSSASISPIDDSTRTTILSVEEESISSKTKSSLSDSAQTVSTISRVDSESQTLTTLKIPFDSSQTTTSNVEEGTRSFSTASTSPDSTRSISHDEGDVHSFSILTTPADSAQVTVSRVEEDSHSFSTVDSYDFEKTTVDRVEEGSDSSSIVTTPSDSAQKTVSHVTENIHSISTVASASDSAQTTVSHIPEDINSITTVVSSSDTAQTSVSHFEEDSHSFSTVTTPSDSVQTTVPHVEEDIHSFSAVTSQSDPAQTSTSSVSEDSNTVRTEIHSSDYSQTTIPRIEGDSYSFSHMTSFDSPQTTKGIVEPVTLFEVSTEQPEEHTNVATQEEKNDAETLSPEATTSVEAVSDAKTDILLSTEKAFAIDYSETSQPPTEQDEHDHDHQTYLVTETSEHEKYDELSSKTPLDDSTEKAQISEILTSTSKAKSQTETPLTTDHSSTYDSKTEFVSEISEQDISSTEHPQDISTTTKHFTDSSLSTYGTDYNQDKIGSTDSHLVSDIGEKLQPVTFDKDMSITSKESYTTRETYSVITEKTSQEPSHLEGQSLVSLLTTSEDTVTSKQEFNTEKIEFIDKEEVSTVEPETSSLLYDQKASPPKTESSFPDVSNQDVSTAKFTTSSPLHEQEITTVSERVTLDFDKQETSTEIKLSSLIDQGISTTTVFDEHVTSSVKFDVTDEQHTTYKVETSSFTDEDKISTIKLDLSSINEEQRISTIKQDLSPLNEEQKISTTLPELTSVHDDSSFENADQDSEAETHSTYNAEGDELKFSHATQSNVPDISTTLTEKFTTQATKVSEMELADFSSPEELLSSESKPVSEVLSTFMPTQELFDIRDTTSDIPKEKYSINEESSSIKEPTPTVEFFEIKYTTKTLEDMTEIPHFTTKYFDGSKSSTTEAVTFKEFQQTTIIDHSENPSTAQTEDLTHESVKLALSTRSDHPADTQSTSTESYPSTLSNDKTTYSIGDEYQTDTRVSLKETQVTTKIGLDVVEHSTETTGHSTEKTEITQPTTKFSYPTKPVEISTESATTHIPISTSYQTEFSRHSTEIVENQSQQTETPTTTLVSHVIEEFTHSKPLIEKPLSLLAFEKVKETEESKILPSTDEENELYIHRLPSTSLDTDEELQSSQVVDFSKQHITSSEHPVSEESFSTQEDELQTTSISEATTEKTELVKETTLAENVVSSTTTTSEEPTIVTEQYSDVHESGFDTTLSEENIAHSIDKEILDLHAPSSDFIDEIHVAESEHISGHDIHTSAELEPSTILLETSTLPENKDYTKDLEEVDKSSSHTETDHLMGITFKKDHLTEISGDITAPISTTTTYHGIETIHFGDHEKEVEIKGTSINPHEPSTIKPITAEVTTEETSLFSSPAEQEDAESFVELHEEFYDINAAENKSTSPDLVVNLENEFSTVPSVKEVSIDEIQFQSKGTTIKEIDPLPIEEQTIHKIETMSEKPTDNDGRNNYDVISPSETAPTTTEKGEGYANTETDLTNQPENVDKLTNVKTKATEHTNLEASTTVSAPLIHNQPIADSIISTVPPELTNGPLPDASKIDILQTTAVNKEELYGVETTPFVTIKESTLKPQYIDIDSNIIQQVEENEEGFKPNVEVGFDILVENGTLKYENTSANENSFVPVKQEHPHDSSHNLEDKYDQDHFTSTLPNDITSLPDKETDHRTIQSLYNTTPSEENTTPDTTANLQTKLSSEVSGISEHYTQETIEPNFISTEINKEPQDILDTTKSHVIYEIKQNTTSDLADTENLYEEDQSLFSDTNIEHDKQFSQYSTLSTLEEHFSNESEAPNMKTNISTTSTTFMTENTDSVASFSEINNDTDDRKVIKDKLNIGNQILDDAKASDSIENLISSSLPATHGTETTSSELYTSPKYEHLTTFETKYTFPTTLNVQNEDFTTEDRKDSSYFTTDDQASYETGYSTTSHSILSEEMSFTTNNKDTSSIPLAPENLLIPLELPSKQDSLNSESSDTSFLNTDVIGKKPTQPEDSFMTSVQTSPTFFDDERHTFTNILDVEKADSTELNSIPIEGVENNVEITKSEELHTITSVPLSVSHGKDNAQSSTFLPDLQSSTKFSFHTETSFTSDDSNVDLNSKPVIKTTSTIDPHISLTTFANQDSTTIHLTEIESAESMDSGINIDEKAIEPIKHDFISTSTDIPLIENQDERTPQSQDTFTEQTKSESVITDEGNETSGSSVNTITSTASTGDYISSFTTEIVLSNSTIVEDYEVSTELVTAKHPYSETHLTKDTNVELVSINQTGLEKDTLSTVLTSAGVEVATEYTKTEFSSGADLESSQTVITSSTPFKDEDNSLKSQNLSATQGDIQTETQTVASVFTSTILVTEISDKQDVEDETLKDKINFVSVVDSLEGDTTFASEFEISDHKRQPTDNFTFSPQSDTSTEFTDNDLTTHGSTLDDDDTTHLHSTIPDFPAEEIWNVVKQLTSEGDKSQTHEVKISESENEVNLTSFAETIIFTTTQKPSTQQSSFITDILSNEDFPSNKTNIFEEEITDFSESDFITSKIELSTKATSHSTVLPSLIDASDSSDLSQTFNMQPTPKPLIYDVILETTKEGDVSSEDISKTFETTTSAPEDSKFSSHSSATTKTIHNYTDSYHVSTHEDLLQTLSTLHPTYTQSNVLYDEHHTSPHPPSSSVKPPVESHQQHTGDGNCYYEDVVYNSAEQIPRKDPCEFCFCFRGDIICLQQTCPPPIHGCYATPIEGFCCPRFHCPVHEMHFNLTRPTTTTPDPRAPKQLASSVLATGCEIEGHVYRVQQVVRPASGPCMLCRCESGGMMKCEPRDCQPQAPLLLRLNREFFRKRR